MGVIVQEAFSKGVLFKVIRVYLDSFKEVIILDNLDLPVDLNC